MNVLEVSRYRFECTVKNRASRLRYLEGILRGAYGAKLRQMADCDKNRDDCAGCQQGVNCVYPNAFKPSLVFSPSKRSNETQLPSPFVITGDRGLQRTGSSELGINIKGLGVMKGNGEVEYNDADTYAAGEKYCCYLSLFGNSNFYAAQAVQAMRLALDDSFTKDDLFRVDRVVNELTDETVLEGGLFHSGINSVKWTDDPFPEPIKELVLYLVSPLHLEEENVFIPQPTERQLWGAITHRIRILLDNYGWRDSESALGSDLLEKTHNSNQPGLFKITNSNLKLVGAGISDRALKMRARSTSQAENKPLELDYGLVGNILIQGELQRLMPYFLLAEIAHIGKRITKGLGALIISLP